MGRLGVDADKLLEDLGTELAGKGAWVRNNVLPLIGKENCMSLTRDSNFQQVVGGLIR